SVASYIFLTSSFFFQAEDGIRDATVTGVQTCALPIWKARPAPGASAEGRRRRACSRERGSSLRSSARARSLRGARTVAPVSPSEIGRASCRGRGEVVAGADSVEERAREDAGAVIE